jgi:hypothetical protein
MDTLARSRGQLLFCTVTITTMLDTLNQNRSSSACLLTGTQR